MDTNNDVEKAPGLIPAGAMMYKHSDRSRVLESGECILYPRGDGSFFIEYIGPMLGEDKCNVLRFDLNDNLLKREQEISFRNIISRVPFVNADGELDSNYSYIVDRAIFDMIDRAFAEAKDKLNVFASKIGNECFQLMKGESGRKSIKPIEHVLRKLSKHDSFQSGMCVLSLTSNHFSLDKLIERQYTYSDIDEPFWDWMSREIRINDGYIAYEPESYFSARIIDFEISDEFKNKEREEKVLYYEVNPETFDEFERIYSEATAKIQQIREEVINIIHELNYLESISVNKNTNDVEKAAEEEQDNKAYNASDYLDKYDVLDVQYASKYSSMIYDELSEKFKEKPGQYPNGFWIGCNDVSDIVLNAILDALNGKRFPEKKKSVDKEELKEISF